ncbi:MAG: chromosome partitioning protein ParB [Actinomycetota bacterium]|nr:chromosome partitioning protein ParB [Actinomycetota bacterium]
MDTGFPTSDAQNDFQRARRQRVLAELGRRLRREPDDVALILPFEEVVEALGRAGERYLGLRTVPLDSIVGTVDRSREFDRSFRPLSGRVRGRWERIAAAQRRGESMPPISLYRIGDLHFVRDGHHRVSVARSLGREDIDAYVTEVQTRLGMAGDVRLSDLPLKGHERVFAERVPLQPEQRARLRLLDPWDYALLAEGVEAWGFRAMQERLAFMDRGEVARAWFADEYEPVVRMMREGGFLAPGETEADAYMRLASRRYRLLRTHRWTPEILERIRRESGSPPAS